jgi:tetratricopeptide (TPR) repeat protein
VALSIFLWIAAPLMSAQVRVWEGTLPLATTDEGAPDENPPFDVFSNKQNYPYTIRDNVRETETVQAWRAIYLENEYLKCSILPDLGGHIYTCVDKVNGRPMFYANPSIKKALIGYRGAWSAFGVEFDFPVSHNWVTLSPVDWAYASAADGSASVTVGNRDRVDGMDWAVEIVMRPGSTVLEERVALSNPSDERHRYYWWNNAGVEVWNDSRICYPMEFTASHGFKDIDTWPVDSSGIDLSLISNQSKGVVSRFVYGSREPFMGIYNPHTDAGVVHYANYADLPAKKIWSWGVDANGLEWRKTLSDNDSAYVEVQAGLFRNQETYALAEPHQVIRFSEFWMPVRGIGTISRANLNGVVAMSRKPQEDGRVTLAVGLNANYAVPRAQIEISDGEKMVLEESASVDPAVTWTREIANLEADKKYTFLLKDGEGGTLLRHTEGMYDWTPRDQVKKGPQIDDQAPPVNAVSEEDFLKLGTDKELRGILVGAWGNYQSGLAKFPPSLKLLKASGRLAVSLFRWEEASSLLAQAEGSDTADAELHYYRGIAVAALGHKTEARKEFEIAHRSEEFRAASGLLLAELDAQDHDAAGALKVLEESCPVSSGDLRCIEETVALERTTGDKERARQLAGESAQRYPTSLFLRNELAKLEPNSNPGFSAPELNRHLAGDTNRILNLVWQYNRLGLYADSLELLSRKYPHVANGESEPGAVPPEDDPLVTYYRGFSREKLGRSGKADFKAASHMSLLFIFPNEAETIPVLRAALARNPSDASAHFLLGTTWFSKGMVDPAIEEWKRAKALNKRIPSLDASLGCALLEIKKEPQEAAAVFESGLKVDSANPALYLGLNKAMREMKRPAPERAAMMKLFPDSEHMPTELLRELTDALRESGRSDEADALLAHRFVVRKEGEAPLRPQNQAK